MGRNVGFQLHQPVKNLKGKVITRQLPPTKEELEEARAAGKSQIALKDEDVTVYKLVTEALTAYIPARPEQGAPDIHEDKKYQVYELARKITKVPNDETAIDIDSTKELTLIYERLKKTTSIEEYGFVYEVLEGINNDFKVVPQTSNNLTVAADDQSNTSQPAAE